jgi:hypothetical protein
MLELKVKGNNPLPVSYGSLLAATTRNGFTAVGNIDTFAKLAMTDPGDTLLITRTTAESFYCNPSHILDFLIDSRSNG